MALDVNNSRFFLRAARDGVSFERTLMLGRLGLFVPPRLLKSFFDELDIAPRGEPAFFDAHHDFADDFFKQLGAKVISSMDFSGYEGASHLQDLNLPVPASYYEKFDVVVDGGTMEHVFNFPVAIFNAMSMVQTGGHLLLDLPANNCCGHGFYQFSPELFFRLFQPEYGYEINKVWIAKDFPFSPFYQVRDPAEIHARTMLVNADPVHLFIQARRIGEVKPLGALARYPAQADYTEFWNTNTNPTKDLAGAAASKAGGWKEGLRSLVRRLGPRWYWAFSVRRNANRNHTRARLSNPDFYQAVELSADK